MLDRDWFVNVGGCLAPGQTLGEKFGNYGGKNFREGVRRKSQKKWDYEEGGALSK